MWLMCVIVSYLFLTAIFSYLIDWCLCCDLRSWTLICFWCYFEAMERIFSWPTLLLKVISEAHKMIDINVTDNSTFCPKCVTVALCIFFPNSKFKWITRLLTALFAFSFGFEFYYKNPTHYIMFSSDSIIFQLDLFDICTTSIWTSMVYNSS